MSDWEVRELVEFLQAEYAKVTDPVKAPQMQAYMKSEIPFLGIQKPWRLPAYRGLKKRFSVSSQKRYREAVLALWELPHREEKYAALHMAEVWSDFVTPKSMPLYKKLLVEGAWWDFVDGVAVDLVGAVYLENRAELEPTIDQWIDHPDMWLRRTSIICQIKHKEQTDERRLFAFCLRRADEKEFFIRKAIGWALRAHSYTNPEAVRDFILKHDDKLSGLSKREGAKQLVRLKML